MDPLTPDDPLWKVLGQARPVEPRPNFTQNMVRLARQTPQERGWLAHLKGWWMEHDSARAGLTWAAAAAVVITAATLVYQPVEISQPQVALNAPVPVATVPTTAEATPADLDFPLDPTFESEWKNLEQVGDLVAVHDTSLLTDSEINILLY